MNEFTNPAGNLGNNPFLQAPSTISPMKGKSSETGLAASISRPKSMIPVTRNRFDRYTAQQRMASADILNAHLLMVEIMMTNITQKYIYEVVSCLKERGLMRHNMKRRANELVNLSSDLMKRCNAHDAMQVRTFTETIHPGLSGSFIRGGRHTDTEASEYLLENLRRENQPHLFCYKECARQVQRAPERPCIEYGDGGHDVYHRNRVLRLHVPEGGRTAQRSREGEPAEKPAQRKDDGCGERYAA